MTFRRLILRKKFVAIAALLVVASVGTTVVAQGSVVEAWNQATTRQSENYTSLAFLDTGHLPSYSGAGKVQHMTFRISNHEAATTTYQYRASLSTGSTATLLKQGVVTVHDGQSSDQVLEFMLPRPEMSGQIIVQLVGRSEYITFEVKS
jgi:hypothetical protein